MTEKKKTTTSGASTFPAPRKRGVTRSTDITLGWIAREYPQLEPLRVLAVEWLKGENTRGRRPAQCAGGILQALPSSFALATRPDRASRSHHSPA